MNLINFPYEQLFSFPSHATRYYKWKAKHKEEFDAYQRKYREEHKEEHKKWVQENRERYNDRQKAWRAANPDKVAAIRARYWAKKALKLSNKSTEEGAK